MAWQIGAIETAIAKYQYIEKEQILIGIFSLEKIIYSQGADFKLYPRDFQEIKKEYEAIEKIFQNFNSSPTDLRRRIRKSVDRGNYEHTEKVVHRSEECKKYFILADKLAIASKKISCLHLLIAILENPEAIITLVFNESGIGLKRIKSKTLFYAKNIENSDKADSYFI